MLGRPHPRARARRRVARQPRRAQHLRRRNYTYVTFLTIMMGETGVLSASATVRLDWDIHRLLRALREHLRLEVAFIGELQETERVIRFVDHDPNCTGLAAGDADPLEASYCHQIAQGRLPEFLHNAAEHPVAAALAVTAAFPIGTHLSVPIRLSSGRVYGTFCCFSRGVEPSLDESDLRVVRILAELVGDHIDDEDRALKGRRDRESGMRALIKDPDSLTMVYQPLVVLATERTIGVEALARFGGGGSPLAVFDEAHELGLGRELEMKAVLCALDAFDEIPASIRLNLNVSPATLVHGSFYDAVAGVPPDRLVVEVTEHSAVADFEELRGVAQRLRRRGITLAIDDVGMGLSGLNRILEIRPDELKLDMSVVRDVDTDRVKQALIEGLWSFARKSGLRLIAEGIETSAELEALRVLGVELGQGSLLGRPAPLAQALSRSAQQ